jgi:hypothetical protein
MVVILLFYILQKDYVNIVKPNGRVRFVLTKFVNQNAR